MSKLTLLNIKESKNSFPISKEAEKSQKGKNLGEFDFVSLLSALFERDSSKDFIETPSFKKSFENENNEDVGKTPRILNDDSLNDTSSVKIGSENFFFARLSESGGEEFENRIVGFDGLKSLLSNEKALKDFREAKNLKELFSAAEKHGVKIDSFRIESVKGEEDFFKKEIKEPKIEKSSDFKSKKEKISEKTSRKFLGSSELLGSLKAFKSSLKRGGFKDEGSVSPKSVSVKDVSKEHGKSVLSSFMQNSFGINGSKKESKEIEILKEEKSLSPDPSEIAKREKIDRKKTFLKKDVAKEAERKETKGASFEISRETERKREKVSFKEEKSWGETDKKLKAKPSLESEKRANLLFEKNGGENFLKVSKKREEKADKKEIFADFAKREELFLKESEILKSPETAKKNEKRAFSFYGNIDKTEDGKDNEKDPSYNSLKPKESGKTKRVSIKHHKEIKSFNNFTEDGNKAVSFENFKGKLETLLKEDDGKRESVGDLKEREPLNGIKRGENGRKISFEGGEKSKDIEIKSVYREFSKEEEKRDENLKTEVKDSKEFSFPGEERVKSPESAKGFLKIGNDEVKKTFKSFAEDFMESVKNYKPPITKVNLTLNPKDLGEVEITLFHRKDNLHVVVNANQNALSLFIQNQNDFKNALLNIGFSSFSMNFNDNSNSQNRHGEGAKAGKFFKEKDENEEEISSLEFVVPRYI